MRAKQRGQFSMMNSIACTRNDSPQLGHFKYKANPFEIYSRSPVQSEYPQGPCGKPERWGPELGLVAGAGSGSKQRSDLV